MAVAVSRQPVFAPAIGARARMLMRKIIPRFTRGAIVLADGPPRALAHVWPPDSPRGGVVLRFPDADFFCCHTWHLYIPERIHKRRSKWAIASRFHFVVLLFLF